MFEKEAEEYGLQQALWCTSDSGDLRDAFKDGAEFGYKKGQSDQLVHKQYQLNQLRKANEWHYVKDELPKDNEYVLIYTDLNNCYVAKKVENHFMSKGLGFIPMSTVIAWKEIVLPKESE